MDYSHVTMNRRERHILTQAVGIIYQLDVWTNLQEIGADPALPRKETHFTERRAQAEGETGFSLFDDLDPPCSGQLGEHRRQTKGL